MSDDIRERGEALTQQFFAREGLSEEEQQILLAHLDAAVLLLRHRDRLLDGAEPTAEDIVLLDRVAVPVASAINDLAAEIAVLADRLEQLEQFSVRWHLGRRREMDYAENRMEIHELVTRRRALRERIRRNFLRAVDTDPEDCA